MKTGMNTMNKEMKFTTKILLEKKKDGMNITNKEKKFIINILCIKNYMNIIKKGN